MNTRILAVLMAYLLLSVHSGFAQPISASDRNLIVTDGTAEISGQNDSARISIAVVTEGGSLDSAGSENDAKTRAVLQTAKSLGIKNLKIKTSGYRVTPQRDYKARPPRIKGYEVYNEIEVTLEGFTPEELSKQVTNIVGKAQDSGANSIQSVQFYIKNRETLENEALKKAVQLALQRAKTMAEAADVKLRRIVSLSTQPGQMPPQPRSLRMAGMTAEAEAAAPPMEIGESRIRVQVGIIYEIEP